MPDTCPRCHKPTDETPHDCAVAPAILVDDQTENPVLACLRAIKEAIGFSSDPPRRSGEN